MHGNDQMRPNHTGGTIEAKGKTVADEQIRTTIRNGVVVGCKSLLIRSNPDKNAAIVTVISAGSEVTIDKEHSTEEFYKVCNKAGVKGFCMKRYIRIRP